MVIVLEKSRLSSKRHSTSSFIFHDDAERKSRVPVVGLSPGSPGIALVPRCSAHESEYAIPVGRTNRLLLRCSSFRFLLF
jgi:hypothetical protein